MFHVKHKGHRQPEKDRCGTLAPKMTEQIKAVAKPIEKDTGQPKGTNAVPGLTVRTLLYDVAVAAHRLLTYFASCYDTLIHFIKILLRSP